MTDPTTEPSTEPITEPRTEPTSHPIYDISNHSIGSLEYALLEAINRERSACKDPLPPLTMDSTLCGLSAIRSYECSDHFAHIRPNGSDAYTVLVDYGYNIWSFTDERIHKGTAGLPVNIIMMGWMENDAFSASILSPNFTHIGIGVYTVDGISYITCWFAG